MSRVIGAFLLSLAVMAQPAFAQPSAQSGSLLDEAQALFRKGSELAKKKDWAGAYEAFRKSQELRPSHDTAADLGVVAYKLGKFPEAAKYLAFALRELPTGVAGEKRAAIERPLALAKREVATVRVTVVPNGAEITLDGVTVGEAPLDDPIFMSPGAHDVGASASGYSTRKESVLAKKGESQSVSIELGHRVDPLPSASAPPSSTTPEAGPPTIADGSPPQGHDTTVGESKSFVPVYVAGGVAVVGLGAALVFELGRSSNSSDASSRLDTLGPNGCASGTPHVTECAQIHDSNSAAHRDEIYRNVSLGVAGAAVVFGVGYSLWPNGGTAIRRQSRSVAVIPSLSTGGGAVSVMGNF
jgi:PEGA domain